MLGVDDTDLKLSAAERAAVWSLLASIAASGTTVVAVCSEAPEGAVAVSTGPGATDEPDGTGDGGGTGEVPAVPGPDTGTDRDTVTGDGTTTDGDTVTDDETDDDTDDATKEAADALAETGRA